MQEHLHQESYARSCREIEKLKRCCHEEGNFSPKKQRKLENFLTQHDQESRTVSLFSCDPDLPSTHVSTFFIKLLLPRVREKPSREVGMLRNTREKMRYLGNVFDRQHARRDPGAFHNDSRILSTSLAVLRTEGIENSGCEEQLQSIPSLCFSVRARRKVSGRHLSLMSMTDHAVGIGTCTLSMTLPSDLPSEVHLQNSLNRKNFRAVS